MTIIFDLLIPIIFGFLFFFLVNYFILKSSKSKNIFTNGISTEIITSTENYQEILSSKLNTEDEGFFIIFGKVNKIILVHGWDENDIQTWLESLNKQDYSLTIEIVSTTIDTNWKMFSKEFIVNYNSNPFIITKLIQDQLLNLYKSIEIDNSYLIIIYYAPLTKN